MNKQIHGEVAIVNLPGTGSLINRTWLIYKELFPKLTHFAALMALGGLINVSLGSFVQYSLRNGPSAQALAGVLVVAITTVAFLYYTFIFSGIIHLVHSWSQGKHISVNAALENGMIHFKSVFWVIVLMWFVVAGAGVVLYPAAVFVLGILFSVWYYLATYIVIVEDTRGLEALARSRYLMHGLFFKCLGRAVVAPIAMVLPAAIFIPLLSIPAIGWLLYLVAFGAVMFFGGPFFIVYEFMRYHDLTSINRNIPFYFFPGERRSLITWASIGCAVIVISWIMGMLPPVLQDRIVAQILAPITRPSLRVTHAIQSNTDKILNFFNHLDYSPKTSVPTPPSTTDK